MRTKCLSIYSIVFSLLLAGCATQSKEDALIGDRTVDAALAEADAAQSAGQSDQAMQLLKAAANRYPTEKKPWLKMAQISYEKGSYGEAILQALETLQRDPKDSVANSIVVVSGLRLSTKSLADLRTQNGLSGSVKTEAQDLAKLLRDKLGESVLVPAPRDGGAAQHQSAAAKVHSKTLSKRKGRAAPTPEAKAESDNGSANPFGGLK